MIYINILAQFFYLKPFLFLLMHNCKPKYTVVYKCNLIEEIYIDPINLYRITNET